MIQFYTHLQLLGIGPPSFGKVVAGVFLLQACVLIYYILKVIPKVRLEEEIYDYAGITLDESPSVELPQKPRRRFKAPVYAMNQEEIVVKMTELDIQVARLMADMESEKGTRNRSNERIASSLKEIELRQSKLERIIYMGLGALGVLQFLLSLGHKG